MNTETTTESREAPHPPAPDTRYPTGGYTGPAPAPPMDFRHRSPVLAGIFSALVPGFGNIYNGLFSRGFLNFLVVVSLFFGAIDSGEGPHLALMIPAMIFAYLFGIVDSYRQATLLNYGVTEEEILASQPGRQIGGSMAIGVALFLIGLYGLISQVFDFDLSMLFDYWYVILMAFGGWMIFHGIKSRQERVELDDDPYGVSSSTPAEDVDAA